jgi:hypothetical protein
VIVVAGLLGDIAANSQPSRWSMYAGTPPLEIGFLF